MIASAYTIIFIVSAESPIFQKRAKSSQKKRANSEKLLLVFTPRKYLSQHRTIKRLYYISPWRGNCNRMSLISEKSREPT